jgi:hypothetical protein
MSLASGCSGRQGLLMRDAVGAVQAVCAAGNGDSCSDLCTQAILR